jgi:addiction module HigA family antidote
MSKPIENQYTPDVVSPPGDTLLETLLAIGMSQAELAERTGRPRKTISEIVQGKAAITADTALQFEKVLGSPASFWTNREMHYRESLARQAESARLARQIEWLKTLPIRDMCKRGWIRHYSDSVQQLKEALTFFSVASPEAWHAVWQTAQVSFRQSPAFESAPAAVAAWLRKGEIEAQKIECESYDPAGFADALRQVRELTTRSPEEFQPRMRDLCARAGVAVLFVRELPQTRVCGATRWLGPHKALIQLSLRYKTNDHLWFTFFHEAGHIVKHGKKAVFIESDDRNVGKEEAEADQFSCDLLIPPAKYAAFVQANRYFSEAAVRAFARQVGVAPGIVVGRLQHDRKLPQSHLNSLKRKYEWASPTEPVAT